MEDVQDLGIDMTDDLISKTLSHTVKEIGIPNMRISLKGNFEEIQKAHDSIHEFIYLAPLCVPPTNRVSWHSKSAFLTYHWEAFHSAHRSFLEALAGYYNAAFTLLRLTHELIVKGAFLECLAHKKFRDRSEVLDKDKRCKNLKDTITRAIGNKVDLEEISATIHDMLMVSVDGKVFVEQFEYRPPIKTVIEQLSAWGMLEPIEKPVETLYGIYTKLSADVHVIPDNTDIGRRLLLGKNPFEVDVIPEELSKFMKVLHDVIDIGIVIELNILSDWIAKDKKVRAKLRERREVIENLGLKYSYEKLVGVV